MLGLGKDGKKRINRLSVILPVASGVLLVVFLLFLLITDSVSITSVREIQNFTHVEDVDCVEVQDDKTPLGVVKKYSFEVQNIEHDTYLAFYTVHQYVEVYIDDQLEYEMKRTEGSLVKTVGSNWSFVPLYREDAGKVIDINLIPVYESFRDWKVDFLIGSRSAIVFDRFSQDWPQILMSFIAVFMGVVFIILSAYKHTTGYPDGQLFSLGAFSILLGFWRITDTRSSPFLMMDKPVFLFYITLSAMMIGMVSLIKSVERRYNQHSQKWFDVYCIGAGVLCLIQLILQWFAGIDLRQTLFLSQMYIGIGAILLLGNVIYDRIFYPPRKHDFMTKYSPLLIVIGVVLDIVRYFSNRSSAQLVFSLCGLLIYIAITGMSMMFDYAEHEKRIAENKRMLAETRISTMISQIKPHFVYNTLGTIEQLCSVDPKQAASLVHDFSRYLRGNFSELDNPVPISLSQEIEHVMYYVSIEKVRFPDIEVKYDLQAEDFLIPALSVQPLVENAIKHGLMKLNHGGTVIICSYETEENNCVSVHDNGGGFDIAQELENGKHVGLRNIKERLKIMCDGTLEIHSSPGVGTTAVISIPKRVEDRL